MPKPKISILSPSEKEEIHSKAITLLEEVGVSIQDKKVTEFLLKEGCKIKNGKILFSEDMVNESLKTVPHRIDLYNRDGNHVATLGEEALVFNPASAAIKILDFKSNEPRFPTLDDVKKLAILVDSLKNIDAQSTAVVPSDVPNSIKDAVRLYVILKYSNKPVITGAFTIENLGIMIDMLRVIREDYKKKPWVIFDVSLSTPLTWSELIIRNLFDLAKEKIPAEIISAPQMGATSPATIAGSLLLHHSEILSGIVISQLTNPGAPVIYGGFTAVLQPNYVVPLITAPESILLMLSYREMAKYLDIPVHTYMALSDNKILDYQAGGETMYSALAAAMDGFDIISGPGVLENDLVQSFEKLVLDNEVVGIVKRIKKGYEMGADELAFDIIKEVAILEKHQFLSQKHTKKYLRKEFHFPDSSVWNVTSRDRWDRRDAVEHAHEKVEKILSEYKPNMLSEEKLKKLDRVYRELWSKTSEPIKYV